MSLPPPGPDRRRVLRLITRLNVGGPARQALLLTRSLAEEFPTRLAAGRPTASEGELDDPTVAVTRLPLVRPLDPRLDAAAIRGARRLMNRDRVAIVHTHMAKAGAVGRIAARSMTRRPRTVHTFHGHVLDGYFTPGTERAFIQTERWLARTTDVLVAISPEIRDALLGLSVGRPAQYHLVPLGLDLDPYLAVDGPVGTFRADLGLGPAVPLVGVVGRLVPIKDHGTLLLAVERLPGVHLAVVGDGELRASLEARVAEMNLGDRVHFTGWRHDTPAVLADLDVVALTSRNEGTPVALIEALAAGRPVVATEVGGVASVVRHEVTGLLVPAGDDQVTASAIGRLLADGALGRRLALAGREHVAHQFGARRLVEDIRVMYQDLLLS